MHLKYSVAMKKAFILVIYCQFFRNSLLYSKTVTKLATVLTKKAMIVSKMVD